MGSTCRRRMRCALIEHWQESLKVSCNIAKHCNTLQHTSLGLHAALIEILKSQLQHCNTLQHTATHCSTLQWAFIQDWFKSWKVSCNTATHCNKLQHTARHCVVPSQSTDSKSSKVSCNTATYCNTLRWALIEHWWKSSKVSSILKVLVQSHYGADFWEFLVIAHVRP